VLAEHPLLGVGPGNYKVHYMDPDYRWMPGRGVVPRQLHNMYLEVATETGVVGFVLFAGMLFLALRSLNRVRKSGPTRERRRRVRTHRTKGSRGVSHALGNYRDGIS
jgi:O-antigen ligase